jgi:hypothetical protein
VLFEPMTRSRVISPVGAMCYTRTCSTMPHRTSPAPFAQDMDRHGEANLSGSRKKEGYL